MRATRGTGRDTTRKERSPRRLWFDQRLVIGVVLVIASVLGVVAIVTAADDSRLVYSAPATLSPGDVVYPGELEVSSVRLGEADGRYLSRGDVPSGGVVVTRSVSEGELIPASAVGSASSVRVASVVVPVGAELSHSIVPGAVVDVWSAALTEDRSFGPPAVLVGSATVVRELEPEGIMGDSRGHVVELLVPRERIARVLAAVVDGDAVSLVPVSIPVPR